MPAQTPCDALRAGRVERGIEQKQHEGRGLSSHKPAGVIIRAPFEAGRRIGEGRFHAIILLLYSAFGKTLFYQRAF